MVAPARSTARREGAWAADRRLVDGAAAGRPVAGARAELHVLGPSELAAQARRRKVSRLTAASAAVVVGALLAVAGAQALVADRQVRLDMLQQELSSAVAQNQNLQLERAALSAPGRVMAVAEHRLKMVSPLSEAYLAPVDPGPSVASRAADVKVPPGTAAGPVRFAVSAGGRARAVPAVAGHRPSSHRAGAAHR